MFVSLFHCLAEKKKIYIKCKLFSMAIKYRASFSLNLPVLDAHLISFLSIHPFIHPPIHQLPLIRSWDMWPVIKSERHRLPSLRPIHPTLPGEFLPGQPRDVVPSARPRVKEGQVRSQPLLNDWASHPISKIKPRHTVEELISVTCSFGALPTASIGM